MAREGKRIRTQHLDVRVAASLLRHPRVGLIVPKHRRTSVERNRLKRQLREILRVRLLPSLGPVDVLVRARAEAYGVSFAELQSELEQVRERIPAAEIP